MEREQNFQTFLSLLTFLSQITSDGLGAPELLKLHIVHLKEMK